MSAAPAFTLVITRPAAQAPQLAAQLAAAGVAAVTFPLLAIEPAADYRLLDAALAALDTFALVVFVSPNAVAHALPRLTRPWPAAVPIGVVGPGSAAALRDAGVGADVPVIAPAAQFDSEGLLAALAAADLGPAQLAGRRVLIVRGNGGRALLAQTWTAAGADVTVAGAYRRGGPQPTDADWAGLAALADRDAPFGWSLTSAEAVGHLAALLATREPALRARLLAAPCWVPHPRIAQAAADAGFVTIHAIDGGNAALVAAVAARQPL